MIQAEAALARAQAGLGLAPDGLADAVAAVDAGTLDVPALGAQTAVAGVPTIPFIAAMQARLPPDLARGFHKGATTQDILDTALVLQLRAGAGAAGGGAGCGPGRPGGDGGRAPCHALRRAHLRPARRAGHLRLQGGGLADRRRRCRRGAARPAAPGACGIPGRPRRHPRVPRRARPGGARRLRPRAGAGRNPARLARAARTHGGGRGLAAASARAHSPRWRPTW